MPEDDLEKLKADILSKYEERLPKSKKIFEEAQKWLPGGGTRNVAYYYPYPFFASKAKGCYIFDVDGNEYIDCLNNMTVLIHGHAFPPIVEALKNQIPNGTAHAAPMESQIELARIICERTPSVEELRFCNSGTEATMFAIRATRHFTKKDKIIKTEGGYHGSHDYVEVNINADLVTVKGSKPHVEEGVPKTILKDVFIVPYNDLPAVEQIIKKHHKEIACMILEPIMGSGGGITATTEYLKGLRKLTKEYGILLIFDEVITFRVSMGGMQKLTGVIPDLTAFGKTIGGGLPIGAFGGKREIIEQFNPMNKEFIQHSGTFSGNALSMVAGIQAMKHYDEDAVNRLGGLGDRLKAGLKQLFDELGIGGGIYGVQSLIYTYFFKEPIYNNRDLSYKTIPYLELAKYLQMTLIMNGIYALSRGITPFLLSTPMDEEVIDEILKRFKKALEMVLPIYKDVIRYEGFAAIIYVMLKALNFNEEFERNCSEDSYSLLLVAKDSPKAIKLNINQGKIQFTQIDNSPDIIKQMKGECDGALITTIPTFIGLGKGEVKAIPAILTGKLQLKGIKHVLNFTQYFQYLK